MSVAGFLSAASHRMVLIVWATIAILLTVIFPLVYSLRNRDDIALYLGLTFASLLLFITVAILVAEWTRSRVPIPMVRRPIEPTMPVVLFLTGFATYAILFAYFTISHDLFFRRIGFEGLVERSLDMPIYELIVHRSFMENATTLLCTTVILLLTARLRTSVRVYAIVVWAVTFALYSTFVIFNNRFQSAILYFGICIALGYAWEATKWRKVYLLIAVAAIVGFSAYSFRVTENLRDELYIAGCIKPTILDPTESPMEIYKRAAADPFLCKGAATTEIMTKIKATAQSSDSAKPAGSGGNSTAAQEVLAKDIVRPWDQRLNSLGLVAAITRPAFSTGFGYGSFWIQPLSLYYYYFADREKYREIKEGLRTNPKVYIASHYLNKKIADTPSSILTDAYANFSFVGFVLAGVLVGIAFGWTDAVLRSTTRAGAIVLAFFLMEKALYSEKEMLTFVVDILKFSPVPALAATLLWRVQLRRRLDQNLYVPTVPVNPSPVIR